MYCSGWCSVIAIYWTPHLVPSFIPTIVEYWTLTLFILLIRYSDHWSKHSVFCSFGICWYGRVWCHWYSCSADIDDSDHSVLLIVDVATVLHFHCCYYSCWYHWVEYFVMLPSHLFILLILHCWKFPHYIVIIVMWQWYSVWYRDWCVHWYGILFGITLRFHLFSTCRFISIIGNDIYIVCDDTTDLLRCITNTLTLFYYWYIIMYSDILTFQGHFFFSWCHSLGMKYIWWWKFQCWALGWLYFILCGLNEKYWLSHY